MVARPSGQPASRDWRTRLAHRVHADLPHAYWRTQNLKPPVSWWVKAAVRKCWLWRDITPGPLAATVLWVPFRFGFYCWAVIACIVSTFTVWLDSDHGRTANADRIKHKAKRVLQRACIDCGIPILKLLADPDHRGHVTLLHVEAIEGQDAWDTSRKIRRRMASVFHCKVTYTDHEDGTATIAVHHHDPFLSEPPLPVYLGGDESGPDLRPTWKAIPLGVDQNADVFTITLFEQHILMPGQTGTGKSTTAEAMGVACLAATYVEPSFIDPQNVSLAPFANAAPYAGNPQMGLELLEDFRTDMLKRELEMAEVGASLAVPSIEWPLRVLFIDELARLLDPTLHGSTKQEGERFTGRFLSMLRDVLNTGRKCGFVIVATCTNPRAAVLTDGLRDQFTMTLCFRTRDRHASTVAQGDIVEGFEPHKLPANRPGRAIFTHNDRHQLYTYRVFDDRCRRAVQNQTRPVLRSVPAADSTSADSPDAPYRSSEQSLTDVLTGNEPRRRRGEARGIIVRWMLDHPPATVAEIAAATGLPDQTVKRWVLGVDGCSHPISVRRLPGARYQLSGDAA